MNHFNATTVVTTFQDLKRALPLGGHIYFKDVDDGNGQTIPWYETLSVRSRTKLETAPGITYQLPSGLKVMLRNLTYFGPEILTVTLEGGSTGGTWRLAISDRVTSTLNYNATAAQVQTALRALSTVGSAGVTVSGANGGPYKLTFVAALGAVVCHGDSASLTGGANAFIRIDRHADSTADHDIEIIGGTWDANNLSGVCAGAIGSSVGLAGGGLGGLISMAGVNGLKVSGVRFRGIRGNAPSPLQVAGCSNVEIEGLDAPDVGCDILHVNGPSYNGTVNRITGAATDDGIALQAKDWTSGSPYYGDIVNWSIRNIRLSSCGSHVVKMTMSGADANGVTAGMRHIRLEKLHCGILGTTAMSFFADTDALDPSNLFTTGTAEDIDISDVSAGTWAYRFFQIDHIVRGLKLNGLDLDRANGAAAGIYISSAGDVDTLDWNDLTNTSSANVNCVVNVSGGRVRKIRFAGGSFQGRSVVAAAPLVLVDSGTVGAVILSGIKIDAPLGYVVQVNGGTVDDVVFENVPLTGGTSGNPPVVYTNAPANGTNNAGLHRVHYNGGSFSGITALTQTGSSAAPLEVWHNGCLISSVVHPLWCQGSTVVLHQNHAVYDTMVANIARLDTSTNAAVVIFSNGSRMINSGGAVVFTNAAPGSCRYVGQDIAQDETVLNGAVKWDQAMSLTSSRGPVIYDGSSGATNLAAWQKNGHT